MIPQCVFYISVMLYLSLFLLMLMFQHVLTTFSYWSICLNIIKYALGLKSYVWLSWNELTLWHVFRPRRFGFEPESGHVERVVDKATLGQVFTEYCCFPCQSFHRLLHTHQHPTSGAGTIDQVVADVPNSLSHLTPINLKKILILINEGFLCTS
jgi:hypothetical protein